MLKRVVLIFFTCVLSMAFSFCSFADFSDSLELYVPSASNAIVVPNSTLGSVSNTISADGVAFVYDVVDSSDTLIRTVKVTPQLVNGRFSVPHISLSGDEYISRVGWIANSLSLPPAGNYMFSFDFTSDFSFDYSSWMIWSRKITDNASDQNKSNVLSGVQTLSGDAYLAPTLMSLTNVQYIEVYGYISGDLPRNFGGSFSVSFSVSSDSGGMSTAGTDTSQQDWENNISSSLGDISSSLSSAEESLEYISQSQNLIIQGIDNVILHISDQLYAFWDQLYNLIHVPTMAKLDDIIDAINNLKLDVTVDLDELLDTLNQNHEDQIANDNSIADQIQNGYDDSSLSSDNDRLNTVIDQYDDVEDQLFTDSKDYISNFEFTDSLAPFLGPLTAISGFLSGIYVALGSLNIPIAFSLSLSIALLMIGWYRFRGGG